MQVRNVMSQPAVTCPVNATLDTVARCLWECDLGSVPLVDDSGRVVGVVTDRDICMAAYMQGLPLNAIPAATAMAKELIQKAQQSPESPTVIAHTLPEKNASGRVLTKAGMQFMGEVQDPEDGLVWRWQLPKS